MATNTIWWVHVALTLDTFWYYEWMENQYTFERRFLRSAKNILTDKVLVPSIHENMKSRIICKYYRHTLSPIPLLFLTFYSSKWVLFVPEFHLPTSKNDQTMEMEKNNFSECYSHKKEIKRPLHLWHAEKFSMNCYSSCEFENERHFN